MQDYVSLAPTAAAFEVTEGNRTACLHVALLFFALVACELVAVLLGYLPMELPVLQYIHTKARVTESLRTGAMHVAWTGYCHACRSGLVSYNSN